jgi:hypothetical protein
VSCEGVLGFEDELEGLFLDQVLVPPVGHGQSSNPGRQAGRFLKGPIPLAWLRRAAVLPGKALAVGLAVWFLSGLRGGRKDGLKLTRNTLEQLGVTDRWAKSRGLQALREAGLIEYVSKHGKNPVVTLLEVREDDAAV